MTETVRTRAKGDCFLACVAMATGRTYEDAAEAIGKDLTAQIQETGAPMDRADGMNGTDRVLARLGLEKNVHYIERYFPSWSLHAAEVLWGRRAILGVRSKNDAPGHAIYWDGTRIHDPTRTDRAFTSLDDPQARPAMVWMFNETEEGKTG